MYMHYMFNIRKPKLILTWPMFIFATWCSFWSKNLPLVWNNGAQLFRSGVSTWMAWCSINISHSFITCVIAIDLVETA